jgi:DNA-binding transcriptional MerR regulator
VNEVEWYTVGQVAKQTGVNPKTIRYYDKVGLLKPSGATAGGYRLYRAEDVERLEFILTLRQVGYPLREIRKILDANIDPENAIDLQLKAITEQIGRLTTL